MKNLLDKTAEEIYDEERLERWKTSCFSFGLILFSIVSGLLNVYFIKTFLEPHKTKPIKSTPIQKPEIEKPLIKNTGFNRLIEKIEVPIKRQSGAWSVGTCFFMADMKCLFSAGHVIEDHPLAIISNRCDIGLMKIKESNQNGLVPFKLTHQNKPEYIWVIGYSEGKYREIKSEFIGFVLMKDSGPGKAWVNHIKIKILDTSGKWSGLSGAPVLMPDKKRVIGILTGGYSYPVIATAVPISEALILWEECNQ